MITEVLLLLPLHVILLFIWQQFWHVIIITADLVSVLNEEDEFFTDILDTSKEGVE